MTGKLIRELSLLRTILDQAASRRKKQIIEKLKSSSIRSAAQLLEYHETLLFLVAYPETKEISKLVESELKRLFHTLSSGGVRPIPSLEDSGLAGTSLRLHLGFDILCWLIREFPDDVNLEQDEELTGNPLLSALTNVICSVERDGIIIDDLSTEQWIEIAKGERKSSDLSWLLLMLQRLKGSSFLLDQIFNSLELPLYWNLTKPEATRTLQRFPKRTPFTERKILKRGLNWSEIIKSTLPAPARLQKQERRKLLSTVRLALCVRDRETDPVTYANEQEIDLFQLERGVDVAVIGTQPEYRRPIESYFGFMAARNGVPMAYGGSWIFGQRAEIGVNIFDTFRGGESLFLFSQIMRAYYGRFGARYFTVAPYQFGHDNPEAIESGAYWFYYRLGFRSVDSELAAVAAREWVKISSQKGYRTSHKILRRLATLPIALDLRNARASDSPILDVTRISIALTDLIGQRDLGDRNRALRRSFQKAKRILPVQEFDRWPSAEQESFRQLCILAAEISDLSKWSVQEQEALVSLMRAKSGKRERSYTRKVQRHRRFLDALAKIEKRGVEIVHSVSES
jgi:hypothetical protein